MSMTIGNSKIRNSKIGKRVEESIFFLKAKNKTTAIDYPTHRNEAQTVLVRVKPFASRGEDDQIGGTHEEQASMKVGSQRGERETAIKRTRDVERVMKIAQGP